MESHRLLLGAVVFGAMIFALAFGNPSITGFVPTATYSQGLDISVSQSQRFVLGSPTDESFELTSLALSGSVSGQGLVNVYVSDGSQRLLVFSNKEKRGSAMEHITGLAISNLMVSPGKKLDLIETTSADYNVVPGGFENVCVDTCALALMSRELFLDIIIEPGVSLTLNEMRFTVLQ